MSVGVRELRRTSAGVRKVSAKADSDSVRRTVRQIMPAAEAGDPVLKSYITPFKMYEKKDVFPVKATDLLVFGQIVYIPADNVLK